ncbi:OsmC family protein [Halorussus ruber]|uniref:OsmC family protein n=1 Tax=Halorussus ruber TaxID=1126238 RepID=UPI0010926437|nr:OsmC family protein [Halorussus ruber]
MTTRNGIEMEKLEKLTEAAEADPENAVFSFSAETEWAGEPTCETTVSDIVKGGKVAESPEFTMEGALMGHREAPTATEQLLGALGTCLTVSYAAHGAKLGIDIDRLRFEFEGEVDMRGLLGIADVRPGYDEIECTAHIETDATDEELEELKTVARENSPLVDNLTNDVSLSFDLQRAE